MSFDKYYPNRKDHRKPFETKAERLCSGCRHGGSCKWCKNNRTIDTVKLKLKSAQELKLELIDEELPETV